MVIHTEYASPAMSTMMCSRWLDNLASLAVEGIWMQWQPKGRLAVDLRIESIIAVAIRDVASFSGIRM
jgi:hypothetical protein